MELRKLNLLDEALAYYDRALALRRDDIGALNNRAGVLIDLNRIPEALASYDQSLSIDPNNFHALAMRGLAFERLNRPEEALGSYDKALSVVPSAVEVLYNRGNVLADLSRFEEALASYDRVLALSPNAVVTLNNRGLVLEEINCFEEALASYEQALTIKPEYRAAADNRKLLLEKLHRSRRTPEALPQNYIAQSFMSYDIEADWQLLNTCNYRCQYCFFPPAMLGERLNVHGEPELWKRAFDRTGLTWLLHITGGEPTIYPRFAELCQLLAVNHYLSFNSNLTHASIIEIAESVDPSRVSFINAALHPEERLLRKGLSKFLEHVAFLKERNFPVFVTIVATPDVLSRVDQITALTKSVGLTPIPKLMRGPYKGKIYPNAYNATERSIFIDFATRARASYGPLLRRSAERPSIDVFADDSYVSGIPDFRGRMCSAGEKFVTLQPDGTVYRCERKQSNYLGNILAGTFQARTGTSHCDSNHCFYFCLKYSEGPKEGSFFRETI